MKWSPRSDEQWVISPKQSTMSNYSNYDLYGIRIHDVCVASEMLI